MAHAQAPAVDPHGLPDHGRRRTLPGRAWSNASWRAHTTDERGSVPPGEGGPPTRPWTRAGWRASLTAPSGTTSAVATHDPAGFPIPQRPESTVITILAL